MSSDSKIAKLADTLRRGLDSSDPALVEASLDLACYLTANGYDLSPFIPRILRCLCSGACAAMAQMLFVDITGGAPDERAVCALLQLIDSRSATKRLCALKAAAHLSDSGGGVSDIVASRIPREQSALLRKAMLLALACLAQQRSSARARVVALANRFLASGDALEAEGALGALAIIGGDGAELPRALWDALPALSGCAQAVALRLLRRCGADADARARAAPLLHSQSAAAVVEAARFFADDPARALPPLLRVAGAQDCSAVFALREIEAVSRAHPSAVAPYADRFLPPKASEVFAHLCVAILANVGACAQLLRWALYYGNAFAAHALGRIGDEDALVALLTRGKAQSAEIAAFYVAESGCRRRVVEALVRYREVRAPVVSVFTETQSEFPEHAEEMLQTLIDEYEELGRDTKYEGSLLAAARVEEVQSKRGNEFLERCEGDEADDIRDNAKILRMMIESKEQKVRALIRGKREIPKPPMPTVYIPEDM